MLEEDPKILPLIPQPLVLVVDDHPTSRMIVARLVRALGYEARTCPSGADALRFLALHPESVRLLLTDLAMPRMDGGELAEQARDIYPHLPVVLMAGATDPHVDELREGYSDFPFLVKPVHLGELAATLEPLLGAPARTSDPPSTHRTRARRRMSGQHRRS